MGENCCCGAPAAHGQDCALCGAKLIYSVRSVERECAVCHRRALSNAVCENGHFVCDECHARGSVAALEKLAGSAERDPVKLFLDCVAMPAVHLHGPEHHAIVPCVLLTAYRNNGGELDFARALAEGWKRGREIPGGACGYLGVCGAAAGAGIYASIVTGSAPLNAAAWAAPQRLTARCLERIADVGGPRCCKRTGRLALEEAAAFTEEEWGVAMPVSRPPCAYSERNRECLRGRCPFYGGGEA